MLDTNLEGHETIGTFVSFTSLINLSVLLELYVKLALQYNAN
jgi:hypothetical protein